MDYGEERELLRQAVERADAMSELLARLVGGTIAVAGEAVVDELRALAAAEVNHKTMADALGHLARLDHMLTLAVAVSARRVRGLADRLAVAEEFSDEPAREPFSAARAVALAESLAAHSRLAFTDRLR